MIPSPGEFRGPDAAARVLSWLLESDGATLESLWRGADRARQEHVGDEVHLRGLVEISNHCVRGCTYCGIRAARRDLERYRMRLDEVLACGREARARGYGTIVLQGGEDDGLDVRAVASLVRAIRDETGLAVTLSLGERDDADLEAWRDAGAERYLLRFETSDEALFRKIHPPLGRRDRSRLDMLLRMRAMGYEIGSGVMVGIPGQSWESLARDVLLFGELDLDMIGIGPFLRHPATPLGRVAEDDNPTRVPSNEHVVFRVLALARLVCPEANIPSTTALSTVSPGSGRMLALARGANVVMPNLTPSRYRGCYDIYPGKSGTAETAEVGHDALIAQLAAAGRRQGTGAGGRRRRRFRSR